MGTCYSTQSRGAQSTYPSDSLPCSPIKSVPSVPRSSLSATLISSESGRAIFSNQKAPPKPPRLCINKEEPSIEQSFLLTPQNTMDSSKPPKARPKSGLNRFGFQGPKKKTGLPTYKHASNSNISSEFSDSMDSIASSKKFGSTGSIRKGLSDQKPFDPEECQKWKMVDDSSTTTAGTPSQETSGLMSVINGKTDTIVEEFKDKNGNTSRKLQGPPKHTGQNSKKSLESGIVSKIPGAGVHTKKPYTRSIPLPASKPRPERSWVKAAPAEADKNKPQRNASSASNVTLKKKFGFFVKSNSSQKAPRTNGKKYDGTSKEESDSGSQGDKKVDVKKGKPSTVSKKSSPTERTKKASNSQESGREILNLSGSTSSKHSDINLDTSQTSGQSKNSSQSPSEGAEKLALDRTFSIESAVSNSDNFRAAFESQSSVEPSSMKESVAEVQETEPLEKEQINAAVMQVVSSALPDNDADDECESPIKRRDSQRCRKLTYQSSIAKEDSLDSGSLCSLNSDDLMLDLDYQLDDDPSQSMDRSMLMRSRSRSGTLDMGSSLNRSSPSKRQAFEAARNLRRQSSLKTIGRPRVNSTCEAVDELGDLLFESQTLPRRGTSEKKATRPASFPGPTDLSASMPDPGPVRKLSLKPPRQPTISDDEVINVDGFTYRHTMQDLRNFKTMLLKLKRVIQDDELGSPMSSSMNGFKFGSQPGTPTLRPEEMAAKFNFGMDRSTEKSIPDLDIRDNQLEDVMQENAELRSQLQFMQKRVDEQEKTINLLQQQMSRAQINKYPKNNNNVIKGKPLSKHTNTRNKKPIRPRMSISKGVMKSDKVEGDQIQPVISY